MANHCNHNRLQYSLRQMPGTTTAGYNLQSLTSGYALTGSTQNGLPDHTPIWTHPGCTIMLDSLRIHLSEALPVPRALPACRPPSRT